MKPNEADQIIAEYMGALSMHYMAGGQKHWTPITEYSKSLDALVPVWEKLKIHSMDLELKDSYAELWTGEIMDSYSSTSETLQEAAAIATARCIQELNNE